MDENNQDGSEVLETTEEVVTDTVEPSGDDTDDVEALKEANKKLFARAKKAEGFVQDKDGNWVKPVKKAEAKEETPAQHEGLSNKDILFLAKAEVHEDDLDEVLDWAKYKKISVAEAHAQLKPQLDVKAEERRTAQAAQVKGPRGTSKTTPEAILKQASEGKLPETSEGIDALAEARMAGKLPK